MRAINRTAKKTGWERTSGWDQWELREAVTILANADTIRRNRPLLKAVQAEANRQLKAAERAAATIKGAK